MKKFLIKVAEWVIVKCRTPAKPKEKAKPRKSIINQMDMDFRYKKFDLNRWKKKWDTFYEFIEKNSHLISKKEGYIFEMTRWNSDTKKAECISNFIQPVKTITIEECPFEIQHPSFAL